MAYLHERNVIHGDLKPANVLLRGALPDILVKLCDFGEAKRVEQSPTGSSSTREISMRSDVWSFGAILAHLEARVAPFNPAPPMPFFMSVMSGELVPSWPLAVQQLALDCVFGSSKPRGGGTTTEAPRDAAAPKVSPTRATTFQTCATTLDTVARELGVSSAVPGDVAHRGAGSAQRMPYLMTPSPYVLPESRASGTAHGWAAESRLDRARKIMRHVVDTLSPRTDPRLLAGVAQQRAAVDSPPDDSSGPSDSRSSSTTSARGAGSSREGSMHGGMIRRKGSANVVDRLSHLAALGARGSIG